MKIAQSLLRMFIIALTAFCLRCTSLNEAPLAGGSGAGNPGGTVSVALTIFTDTVHAKTAVVTGTVANITDNANPFVTVKDMAGLPIAITGVQINSSDLRLVLDERDESRCVLDSFKERPPYLSSDSQSLIINKRFSFDALHGTPDSTVPPVIMPVARYTGVILHFNKNPLPQTDTGWKSDILINGRFLYNRQTQNFKIEIDRSFSPLYNFGGGSFTLSTTDTTHLELRFNASQWFRRVNFKQYLDTGLLIFNPKSPLIISSNSTQPDILDIEFQINTDFINSAKLAVY
jgi:hypothetical protein